MTSRSVHVFMAALVGCAIVVAMTAGPARANVYPAQVVVDSSSLNNTCGALKVTYVLNENANGMTTPEVRPGVRIQVMRADTSEVVRTVTYASQAKGTHVFEWDGRKDDGTQAPGDSTIPVSYKVVITAADTGHSAWSKISDDTADWMKFYVPAGVAINKNELSPNYGKVYVANGTVGTPEGGDRQTQDGVYAISADLNDDGFYTGGRDWVAAGASAPWRLAVGPDSHVYVSDLANDLSFEFSEDMSTLTQLTDASNLSSVVYSGTTYTQFVASILVEGTQAAGNRKIYLGDSNYYAANPGFKGIIRYDLGGNATATSGDKGTQIVGYGAGNLNYFATDIARGADGKWYVTQNRSSSNQAYALTQFPDLTTYPITVPNWGTPKATYTGGYGLDVYDAKNRVAYGSINDGDIYFFNVSDGSFVEKVDAGTHNRDLAFDAAGNMYTVDNYVERLRVWSPPDGPNYKATTTAEFSLARDAGGPTITTQPQNAQFCPNGSASLTVAATGTGTVTYQWKMEGANLSDGTNGDGVVIAGSTSSSLSLSSVPGSYAGKMLQVVVCDDTGVRLSQTVLLQVGVQILSQPASVTLCGSDPAADFSISAIGVGTVSYQWQKDNAGDDNFTDIGGATTTSLSVASPVNLTKVRCNVTDTCGTVTSAVATITIRSRPTIGGMGFPQTVAVGSNATWIANASGYGTLHYQWYKTVNGVKTAIGADSPTLIFAVQKCDNWVDYSVSPPVVQKAVISCVVTDQCGLSSVETNKNWDGTLQTLTVGTGAPVPQNTEATCSDDEDNDCSGLIDCASPQCVAAGFCCNQPWADAEGPLGVGAGKGDTDVDMDDFAQFQLCYTGVTASQIPPPPSYCWCFDRTGPTPGTPDGLIDALDFAAFSLCATGPSVPWVSNPNCP